MALVILLIVLAAGGYAYLRFRYDQIRTVHVAGLAPELADHPFNVLMIGSDSRAALAPNSGNTQAFGSASQVAGQRSDVTSILHVDPVHHAAAILSIPRDLFVPLAGTNGSNRINEAFDHGPSQLVQTIQADLGIPVQHYVEVNFAGFQGAVDALGGVRMSFPFPARDAYSGLEITTTGCQTLNGAQGLAVARARHYRYYENGYWHYDGSSDLGRIARQHVFLRAVAKAAVSRGLTNPLTANAFLGQAVNDFVIDDAMSMGDLVGLARLFKGFDPASLASYTLPTTPVTNYQSYGDVLLPKQPDDSQVIAAFLNPAPGPPAAKSPSIPPAQVSVEVLNGVGKAGIAHTVASELHQAGFNVVGTGNAGSFTYGRTVIAYASGFQAQAQVLQSRVVGGALLEEDHSLTGAQVALVIGTQWAGVQSAGTAATPTTQAPGGPAPATVGQDDYQAFDPTTC
ncbi:MAG TPA: LCP family protein [Acidimicrobiales bacterium]|nr:LCP family protein [Acidimicrobiales bacterium]